MGRDNSLLVWARPGVPVGEGRVALVTARRRQQARGRVCQHDDDELRQYVYGKELDS
jgi:hypothetical protein